MNPKLRNIILIVLLIAVLTTFHFVRRNSTMRGISTTVERSSEAILLTEPDVDSLILMSFPDLLSKDIKDVEPKAVKKALEGHPYIFTSDVKMTWSGKLEVNVRQRVPVARVFYQGNEYYLSREGTCMPLSEKHYCNVLIASSMQEEPLLKTPTAIALGDTSNHHQPAGLQKQWVLSSLLYDHPEYGEVFDQVCIDENGDLCAVPKLSSLYVVVGDTTALQEKFENLWAFFNQGINQVGWSAYTAISLKYKGQVVCTQAKLN